MKIKKQALKTNVVIIFVVLSMLLGICTVAYAEKIDEIEEVIIDQISDSEDEPEGNQEAEPEDEPEGDSKAEPEDEEDGDSAETQTTYTVEFYDFEGINILKTIKVAEGESIEIPQSLPSEKHTFLGWSTSTYQSTNPLYLPGECLHVISDMKLYAVMFDVKALGNISAKRLPRINTKKYSRIIFVGDSKTARLHDVLRRQLSSKRYRRLHVSFVAKGSTGVHWLEKVGEKKLIHNLKKSPGSRNRPVAIVFNHGINNLFCGQAEISADEYVRYMRKLAEKLKPYHVKLFYNSVQLSNSQILKKLHKGIRREEDIHFFNSKIKEELCGSNGSYTYIDTLNYLCKNGFAYGNQKKGKDTNKESGIHYSSQTSKIIYKEVIKQVNKNR